MGCNSQPIQDVIALNLIVEDTIKSSQANLTVYVETVLVETTPENTRGVILDGLKSIANAQWDISNLKRFNDSSGYEKWVVLAKTRVDESALNNLTAKCKGVSKKGLQFKVGNVDYVPTTAEYQAFYRDLRKRLLVDAGVELAMVAEVTGRAYRLANVQFYFNTEGANNTPQPKQYMTESVNRNRGMVMACASPMGGRADALEAGGDDDSETGSESFAVSQKVTASLQGSLAVVVG